MRFAEYEALFNAGDDAALIDRFYADECEFVATTRHLRGKAALKGFLDWAHDGVREVMRPQLVIEGKDHVFVEVDMDFHATKERADFPFGHLHPGDCVTVKFFVTYYLREDGRIVRLNSATWPPEYQVSKLPKLGGHPSQMAAFRAYTSAFSNADFDRFRTFYTDDVVLELGVVPPIHGAQGIVDFYTGMFGKVRENLIVHKVLADDEAIALDSTTCFTAIEDAPDFPVMPLKKGEEIRARVFVHYRLRDGLISHIKIARGGAYEKVAG
ncbi:MAG TPA: nuclear transport factor 2 family protein [Sphingomonadaceae bacterium]|nr:nuclear transport factor 2 family protein [Sphingomonadaceae bacterium]